MNLILIEPDEISDNTVTLTDRRCDHIIKILRSKKGDRLRVGCINKNTGTGTIAAIEKKKVILTLQLDGPIPDRSPTDLILALPRPIMLKRVFSQATALGVGRIFLTNANRVEKSFFNASLLEEKNYRNFLLSGLEQSMDTIVPEVHIYKRFKPFIEDELPNILQETPLRLLAHPTASKEIWQAQVPSRQRAVLAIGPEGGWIDYEIEKFQEQNFIPFSLGPRILRVDTAVPATLAQLNLLRRINL